LQDPQAADAQRPIEVRADSAGLGCRSSKPSWTSARMARFMRLKRSAVTSACSLARSSRSVSGPSSSVARSLRPQPDTIGDVILGDDEIFALVVAAANDDVAVRMTGVEVIHRDPIEPRAEILLHLPQHVPADATDTGVHRAHRD